MPRFECADVPNAALWYDVYGHGSHAVLMLPGAIGTAESDFRPQVNLEEDFHLDYEKFSLVCVELTGWARAAPPVRVYDSQVLQRDAECCDRLMSHLGFDRYTVLGWSEGSKVALLIGRKHGSERIRSMVLLSVMSYASQFGTEHLLWSRNIDNWDRSNLDRYLAAYGGDRNRVAKLWSKHMDFIAIYGDLYPINVLGPVDEGLARLEPPVLVLHGDKDFFVEFDQPKLLEQHVPDCQIVRFHKGTHNFHQEQPEKFKKIVEQFLKAN